VSGDPSIRAAGFDITSRLGTIDISQSVAEDNDAGFVATTAATGRVSLTRNLAARNTDVGFSVAGTGSGRNLLDHDRAVSNGLGFQLSGANHRIDFSTALANARGGFSIGGSNNGLAHDSAINNRGPGFLVVGGASGITLRSTNTFGNVGAGTVGAAGCGIVNASGRALNASGTFFGRSTGPGADPADGAGPGSGCDVGSGSVTTVAPPAVKAYVIE
jgi:hypothetical protein